MNRVNLSMKICAKRLLVYESRGTTLGGAGRPSVYLVCEKLRPPLATLVGTAGFHALLARAAALARTEMAWPGEVRVNTDGSLEGLDEIEAQVTPHEFTVGSVVLISQLLGLLATFIGEELTFRQLDRIWPPGTTKRFR